MTLRGGAWPATGARTPTMATATASAAARSVRVNRITRPGHAVLVERLDGDVVVLPGGKRPNLERRTPVGEHLVGLVELVRGDTPENVVAHGARYRLPRHERVARIRVAADAQAAGRRGSGRAPVAEDPDVADGQMRGLHVQVLVADIAR